VEEHKVRLGIILLRDYPLPPVLRTYNLFEARWDQAVGRENLDWLRALRRHSEDERQRQERQKHLNQALDRARTLLAEGDFELATAVLETGQKEFPTDSEVRKLFAQAQRLDARI
jgi:hypothetical protein